jgi:hypothetical protein
MDELTEREAGWNPPGRRELVFRPGTYETFLERMLDEVPLQPALGNETAERAGASLGGPWSQAGERWDVIPALLDAWAAVGDVLGFYQERLLNEGFLRTAVEPFSQLQLSASLGFGPEHGMAASTWLAFSVAAGPGAAPSVTLPAGTGAASVPGPGEDPQPYETSAPLVARPEWNAMPLLPATVEVRAPLGPEPCEARVEGVSTGLAPGAPVLLDAPAARVFGAVATVEADPDAGYTLVQWTPAPGGSQGDDFAGAKLFGFAVQAPLFGHDAAAWDTLPDEEKRLYSTLLGGVHALPEPAGGAWARENDGLPVVAVRALAAGADGTAYAGTAGAGVFRRVTARGGDETKPKPKTKTVVRWEPCGAIPLGDVYALAPGFRGQLLAGLSGGRVYRSSDGGQSWDPVSGVTLQEAEVGGTPVYIPLPAVLPDTPVRALATWFGARSAGEGEQDGYLAGTDTGVYFATDAGGAWAGMNAGLPGYDAATGAAAVSVWAFACRPEEPPVVYAGTGAGVYAYEPGGTDSPDGTGRWSPVCAGPTHPKSREVLAVRALAFGFAWGTHGLLAGTEVGVYRLVAAAGGGEAWDAMNAGLPTDPATGLPPAVRALAPVVAQGGTVYAGTAAGAWAWDTAGGRWTAEGDAPRPRDVQALALAEGGLLAATPFAGFVPDRWPRPAIQAGVAYLDGVFPEIARGTRVVFQQRPSEPEGAEPLVAVRRVQSSEVVQYAAYGIDRAATRVTVAEPGPPPAEKAEKAEDRVLRRFDMRTTLVYAAAAELPLARRSLPAPPDPPERAAPALRPLASAELYSTRDPEGRGSPRLRVRRATLPGSAPPEGEEETALLLAAREGGGGRAPRVEGLTGRRLVVAGPVPAMEPQRAVAVTGLRARAALVPEASVFGWSGGGWSALGLASLDVDAVAAAGTARFAAVTGPPPPAGAPDAVPAAGLYQDGGAGEWTRVDALGAARVLALATAPDGGVWAGTEDGAVWRGAAAGGWERVGGGLARLPVACLAVDGAGVPLAGTRDAGAWRLEDGRWTPLGAGLPREVRALAAPAAGGVLAATGDGVWRLGAGAGAWTREAEGLRNLDVRALALLPGGGTAAGTGGGVYVRAAAGGAWRPASLGLAGAALDVRALAAAADGTLWAGTRGAGAWRSAGGGAAWAAAPAGAAGDVRALAVDGAALLAGCGARPLLDTDQGAEAAFDLDALFALAPGYAAELDRGDLSAPLRDRFGEAGTVLDPLAYVEVRERGRAWLIQQPAGVLALRLEAGLIRVRAPRALATLLAAPPEPAPGAEDAPAALLLRDPVGRMGTLAARPGELAWRPAAADDAGAGEVAVVVSTGEGPTGGTALVLAAPLEHAYDPATVAVLGNLAPATHGGTTAEVLGSGNAAQPGQRFRLSAAPLTWVEPPAPGMSGETLRVRVDGVEWQPVETLYGQPGDAPVYTVRVDPAGAAALRFGDGVQGARLPSGRENVAARYRVGVGPAGNVRAAAVTQLGTAPVGVEGVTNPVAATGGLPGETAAQARDRAALRARTLRRVVSLTDYGDFALAFPGVAKAAASRVSTGAGPVVAVTVWPQDGSTDEGDAVVRLLSDAIRGARGDDTPFRVMAAARLAFRLACQVVVDPGRDPAEVVAAVAAALAAALSAEQRRLAEPLAASVALSAAQAVPGVTGAWLAAFHLSAATPSVQAVLPSLPARWDARAGLLLPAELLVPHPDGGIAVGQADGPAAAAEPAAWSSPR